MSHKSFSALILALVPTLASAHPGHDPNVIHLHAGIPSAANTLDLRLIFAALVIGVCFQAFRAVNRR
jgi:multisubunit Na+/H+ antiporter MnhC subunit